MSEQYRYPEPQPRPRSGMPVWGWCLVGCGGLVVVGFFAVAILGAILFPVFQQAREKARAASCLANVKQMGTAMMMYEQDYDGQLPPSSRWMDVTTPYTKNTSVYRCPSIPPSSSATFGYAFNRNLSQKKLK